MPDMLPLWFWLPLAIILWPIVILRLFLSVSSAEDPNPNELTRLDIYELTGVYPK